MPSLIQDYGLVGDGGTCALIARDESVDFLCWPQFDSDACFCTLLGNERNGRWQIAPEEHPSQVRRRYRGDTLVLETEFETASGVGGLVRRKLAKQDGHDGHDEGVFLVCSCWLADCMEKHGRHDEARTMLECVIGLSNDVGLLSEEYHAPTQRLIGNMPQALTHLGVVNTALSLSGPTLQHGA